MKIEENLVLPAQFDEAKEWGMEYIEQFGNESTFFEYNRAISSVCKID